MSVLGLLVATDDALVNHVGGRECDTVVDFSGTFPDEWLGDATWGRVLVVADSVTALRAVLPQLASMTTRSKAFELVVGGHPRPGVLRLPVAPVGLRTVTSAQREAVSKPVPHARLTVHFKGYLTLGDALAAFLAGGTTLFKRPAGGLRIGVADDARETMTWACGDPSARLLAAGTPEPADGEPSPVDVVLARSASGDEGGHPKVLDVGSRAREPHWTDLVDAPGPEIERFVTASHARDVVPPVDTDTLGPIGFVGDPTRSETRLRCVRRGERRQMVLDDGRGRESAWFDDWSGLSERVVEHARSYWVVHDDPRAHGGPVRHAAFLVQAACAALPVLVGELSDTVRRLVGAELGAAFESVTAQELTDPVRREAYCMAIRRAAFERHGARRRWAALARRSGLWAPAPPAVSVVVATRRPDLVPRIAEQVGGQDWPEIELVLGLHGFSRDDPRVHELERTHRGALVVAEVDADRPFGEALNDLCSMAAGDLLLKMDDDDWYSRHHVTDLVHAAEYSRADLVGAGAEFMYLEALDLTIRRHKTSGNRFANRVPGAALLIAAHTLRSIGGWRPIHRGLDTAIARAVTDSGGSIYRGHGLGLMVYRAAEGHTWDPGVEYFVRGDIDQWPGFVPPPGIVGAGPARTAVPRSWFDADALRAV
ncbi:glycosyl transferase family 2 [Haloactinopolyspora alba]|uniref:Glycosyl transferase family 2 n=1 Tax=Haloactinopolyspora alba TaxID=648780 RepID=A0A2P8E0W4_9ACTN|nr:glycosyltransferase [Haloactinopolyspora alba]PSL03098.1 glycosyl transferase family 2 [Haloactinopolyspora alba]